MLTAKKKRQQAKASQPVIVVSKSQFDRIMGPDRPSEVPSALRELVIQKRAKRH